jgi:hypothetical protein
VVHFDIERPWDDEDVGVGGADTYGIIECVGCNMLRFRHVSWSSAGPFDDDNEPLSEVAIYPAPADRRSANSLSPRFSTDDPIPEQVLAIYNETIQARNAGAPTLAGAGLRAIVEALCINQKVTGGNLAHKIDQLVTKGLLATPQADALHEERFLGNSALHEIEAPSKAEIEDGLQIVETLLHTIFVLPEHAARMKAKREAKAAKKDSARKSNPGETDDVSV